MHVAKSLEVGPFGSADALAQLGRQPQVQYLRRYLEDLGAATIVAEPSYFDRDYLAEFVAFYCTSAAGYVNVCRRLHFFSEPFDRRMLEAALNEDPGATTCLVDSYLGFVVLRPIPSSPLGRTVLRWYADSAQDTTPRVTNPSRDYSCHLAGLKLTVHGLAWQQQDSAVGACATIALWSALHASALDGLHGMPTTASVTRSAHRTASRGERVFPSTGLYIEQLCEAIKEHGLSPIVVPGDISRPGSSPAFSRERFAATCAAMIRSGYPVLVLGKLGGMGHATCAVGFRSAAPPDAAPGTVVHHDAGIPHIYIHDDNLGPNVRFSIESSLDGVVELKPEAPPRIAHTTSVDPTHTYPAMVPAHLLMAVPEDLKTSPDALHIAGLKAAEAASGLLHELAKPTVLSGLSVSTRFSRLREYLGRDLQQVLAHSGLLGRTRLELVEKVAPMSLHIGIVRIGDGAAPLTDILFDTTDSDSNLPVFVYIAFAAVMTLLLEELVLAEILPPGALISAH